MLTNYQAIIFHSQNIEMINTILSNKKFKIQVSSKEKKGNPQKLGTNKDLKTEMVNT